MKLDKQLKQQLVRSYGAVSVEAADESLQNSLQQNIFDNKEGETLAGALDAFLMENPAYVRSINNKLKREYGSDFQLDYSQTAETDNGTRALTSSNSNCVVVGCADIMMRLYYCDNGIENYINMYETVGVCAEQFPSYSGKPMAGIIGEGDPAPDISAFFTKGTAPANYLVCTTLDPNQIGARVEISRKRMKCNTCLNILEIVMEELPRSIKRRIRKSIYDLIEANATTLTAVSSNIRTVLMKNQNALVKSNKVALPNIYHIMDQVTFNNFFYDVDLSGRPLNTEVGSCAPDICKAYCINGFNIIVDGEKPLGVEASGNYTSTVYSGDLKVIAARITRPEMGEHLINNSIVEGMKIENVVDYADAIPANMTDMLVKRPVTFSVT
jgi:hypothetical protein